MSQIEKLESTLESLQVSLKGWQQHPHCDERTKMIEDLEKEIDKIQKQIASSSRG